MIYESEKGNVRIMAVGDTMLTRGLMAFKEPDYLRLRDLIRSADVCHANLETTVRAPDEGMPNVGVGGTQMTTPPELLEDLKWMGINLLATANNHTCDYGPTGVLAAIAHLRREKFAFAGTGSTLGRARAPGYLDTAAGRIGMVAATSCTSSRDVIGAMEAPLFSLLGRAADPRPDSPVGRPGTNPLRFTQKYIVDKEGLSALMRMNQMLGFKEEQKRQSVHFYSKNEALADTEQEVVFLRGRFTVGEKPGMTTHVHVEDAEAILRNIRDARRRSDWVIFSHHYHELGYAGTGVAKNKAEMEEPAGFVVDFYHAAIDAGADIIAGHGPHVPFGVEIYKGKPIIYSLGNFVLENDTVATFPSEVYGRWGLGPEATPSEFIDARSKNDTAGFGPVPGYWHGLLADCEFKSGKLAALRLHPLDLGFGRKRSERGRPVLASGEVAKITLERIQRLSKRYGTNVVIKDNIGLVSLD